MGDIPFTIATLIIFVIKFNSLFQLNQIYFINLYYFKYICNDYINVKQRVYYYVHIWNYRLKYHLFIS